MKIETFEELIQRDKFGVGAPNDAFARYFVGKSYLKVLTDTDCGLLLANVTFEPGCRNNRHIHRAEKGGGQLLICTAGEGWYGDDKGVIELKEGDVVTIPPGVKHWHGAKKDSFFSHIAVELPGEKTSTEWCEAVSDEEYNNLKCIHGAENSVLETAKSLLSPSLRCAIIGKNGMFTSGKAGISPLIEVIDNGNYFGCIAADRIVGKAAALLYILLEAKEVYGEVMSAEGERILSEFGIKHSYGQKVEYIRNRTGDGVCPMEMAVKDISEPVKALDAIRAELMRLKNK